MTPSAQWFLRLPTSGTDVTYHEDPGKTRPGSAQAYGQAAPGSPPVHLPAPDQSWVFHHLPAELCLRPPGQAGEHCEGHVLHLCFSIPSGLLYWVTSWRRCWWTPPLCPGLWITSLADHSMCTCGTVCQMQWSATPEPRKGLSSLFFSSPFTPQTSATKQSLSILRRSLMTLLSLDVSARVRRLSTGLWWITLSHGVSWTTCSSTQQKPKSWWWIWGFAILRYN